MAAKSSSKTLATARAPAAPMTRTRIPQEQEPPAHARGGKRPIQDDPPPGRLIQDGHKAQLDREHAHDIYRDEQR